MNKILKYQKAGKLVGLLDDIVKAAKKSPMDFSTWGKASRADMLKISGNKLIVPKLSDYELGYLLHSRNNEILKGINSRHAIFYGPDPTSVEKINIFDSPGWNTGYLIPDYEYAIPGTVSTHYVENLTGGAAKGISEDGYNALMTITKKPLSAGRIWKMPEVTKHVYSKFNTIDSNFPMSQEWLTTDLGVYDYKPKWWSSGNSSWKDELEYLKRKAAIDAGTFEGDELYNVVDDFHEDIIRFPIEDKRPIILGPTRVIPTKHEFLFQINPQTIKNGVPVVNWFDPSIWLKNGGKIAKYQRAGWIGKGLNWLFTKGDDVIKVAPKIHNPGFINLVDDAILERQPLMMQRSPQFWTGTSHSQLTRAEQLGLPKHERAMFTNSLGKSKITPEEKIGIPKGERNNGKYNGITFFRTLDVVPGIDDAGFVQVSSPHSLFSNFTTDNLVHTHSWYPSLRSHVIAVSPEAFRGSSLVSTEPSDMFFINNTLKIKPKHVTFISGDPEALALAKSRGFNIMTSPELQLTFKRGRYMSGNLFPKPRLTKHSIYGELSSSWDNWDAYKDLLRETVTTKFSRPTFDIYKKVSNQTGLPISVKPFSGKNFLTTGDGVNWSPSDFRHVVYDPASPIESVIKEKYEIPAWMGSLFGSSDFEKSLINFRLLKLKQSVTPLKNGGTIK